jgi:hypothetical protein
VGIPPFRKVREEDGAPGRFYFLSGFRNKTAGTGSIRFLLPKMCHRRGYQSRTLGGTLEITDCVRCYLAPLYMRLLGLSPKVANLVDQNYYSFENRFYGTQATFSTVSDAANLGLTAASSVIGTAELKSILSATATGATGFKTSVEKNFFDQQSRAAVVSKMRALRATQLSQHCKTTAI